MVIGGCIVRALGALCDGPVRTRVASAGLVTYRAGGPLAVLVEPRSSESARSLWGFCHREGLPTLVIGKGSNLLVADHGFEGVALRLAPSVVRPVVKGRTIEVQGCVTQPGLAQLAADHCLSGGEFLIGIPGTVAGGVYMNAGCHGAVVAGLVRTVRSVMPNGEVRTRSGEECQFGLRHSVFQHRPELILNVLLQLSPGDRDLIREKMRWHLEQRGATQPRLYPHCGSVFRNPLKGRAWKLIADAGLRGHSWRGAQVSEKHANFILNRGRATASDIISLMKTIQERVFLNAAVVLEPELVVAGMATG